MVTNIKTGLSNNNIIRAKMKSMSGFARFLYIFLVSIEVLEISKHQYTGEKFQFSIRSQKAIMVFYFCNHILYYLLQYKHFLNLQSVF